jgi:phage tail sheath protein FI
MGENTSYGCAYYPWIQIRDTDSGAQFWGPPSIAALGVMANTEKQAALWFAPAGFNRGGLSIGGAGITITNVRQKLTSKQRDSLYETNINPIASFPNEGIVVFGQKTLQVTPSALDRINVRRLMNYIKKEVSRMAATILFDQNVPLTWNRFLGRVEPFLASVKAQFGLQDYKVVLDDTTTTAELIDRNIMYAKIFLKPTRAIEFIAIDFNISNTGAAFAD